MPRPISMGLPPGIQRQIDSGDLRANLGNSYLAERVAEYMAPNIIAGTEGDDSLVATDASDIFVLTAGNDSISGFSLTDDLLDISGLLNSPDPSDPEPSEPEELESDSETQGTDPEATNDASTDDSTLDLQEDPSVGIDSDDEEVLVEQTSDEALPDYSALIDEILGSAVETPDSGGVTLTLPNGGSLFLDGITAADLPAILFTASAEGSEDPLGTSLEDADAIEVDGDTVESEDTSSDDAASTVFRLYKAAFARQPDEEGLKFWVDKANKGLEVAKIATGFMESEEFNSTYGENVSNAVFIENLYINILGRAGDDDGSQFWEDYLDNGGAREDTLLGFANSEENIVGVQQDMQAYDMM